MIEAISPLDLLREADFPTLSSHGDVRPSGPFPQDILDECLAGLVTRAYKRTAGAVEEAQIESSLPPHFKDCWRDIFLNFHVSLRWPHVLSKGHNIYVNFAEFYKSLEISYPRVGENLAYPSEHATVVLLSLPDRA